MSNEEVLKWEIKAHLDLQSGRDNWNFWTHNENVGFDKLILTGYSERSMKRDKQSGWLLCGNGYISGYKYKW